MARVAIIALSAILSLGCQTTEMDPQTGRTSVRTFLMEHKTVCRGGTCSSCARGKRVAVLGMLAPAVIEPTIGLPAMAIGLGIEAMVKPDDWCAGWPEVLDLPPEKPKSPIVSRSWRWVDPECIGLAELGPDFSAITSTRWCPPGAPWAGGTRP